MKLICSVYPQSHRVKRPRFQPQSEWVMEAAGPDDVAMLVVQDGITEREYVGHGRVMDIAHATTADKVAADILNELTAGKSVEGMAPTASPGVWVHSNPNATKAQVLASPEYRQAREAFGLLANAYVEQANKFADSRHHADIREIHRICARYLRMGDLNWVTLAKREAKKACQWCGSLVEANAMKCPQCSEIIDVERYNRERKMVEDAMAASAKPTLPPAPAAVLHPKPGQPVSVTR